MRGSRVLRESGLRRGCRCAAAFPEEPQRAQRGRRGRAGELAAEVWWGTRPGRIVGAPRPARPRTLGTDWHPCALGWFAALRTPARGGAWGSAVALEGRVGERVPEGVGGVEVGEGPSTRRPVSPPRSRGSFGGGSTPARDGSEARSRRARVAGARVGAVDGIVTKVSPQLGDGCARPAAVGVSADLVGTPAAAGAPLCRPGGGWGASKAAVRQGAPTTSHGGRCADHRVAGLLLGRLPFLPFGPAP